MPDYAAILKEIAEVVRPLTAEGKVADYIPELARFSREKFGMALYTTDGQMYTVGDAGERFSIQSISKVFTLVMTIRLVGEALFSRVGKEPSGNPFNSLVQLEYEKGIPRNPFINAGALVVTDELLSHTPDAIGDVLDFVRKISGSPTVQYDLAVAASERSNGFTNAALANFLKANHNLKNGVEEVLEAYFYHCSLAMSCEDLARAFQCLANHGVMEQGGPRLLSESQAKRLNAIMLSCGFYDEAGEFAFRVGLPGKSGVGGGIAAVLPGKWSVAVWSPAINRQGNSVAGMKALELLTTLTGESIF